jgi:hypothetical protein
MSFPRTQAVTAAITIHNPAPIDATINDVSGAMSQANDVVSDLPALPALPYTLKAGQDLVIHFTIEPGSAAGGGPRLAARLAKQD